MPRTSKCRRVCAEPRARVFTPEPKSGGRVALSVEELEALRLCDLEGLEQDSAAKRMNVSRGTFQRILYAARFHTAKALCEGDTLVIEGGHYEVAKTGCACVFRCKKCRFHEETQKELSDK